MILSRNNDYDIDNVDNYDNDNGINGSIMLINRVDSNSSNHFSK